jgi:hypothetical protein
MKNSFANDFMMSETRGLDGEAALLSPAGLQPGSRQLASTNRTAIATRGNVRMLYFI